MPNPMLARWQAKLLRFQFDVKCTISSHIVIPLWLNHRPIKDTLSCSEDSESSEVTSDANPNVTEETDLSDYESPPRSGPMSRNSWPPWTRLLEGNPGGLGPVDCTAKIKMPSNKMRDVKQQSPSYEMFTDASYDYSVPSTSSTTMRVSLNRKQRRALLRSPPSGPGVSMSVSGPKPCPEPRDPKPKDPKKRDPRQNDPHKQPSIRMISRKGMNNACPNSNPTFSFSEFPVTSHSSPTQGTTASNDSDGEAAACLPGERVREGEEGEMEEEMGEEEGIEEEEMGSTTETAESDEFESSRSSPEDVTATRRSGRSRMKRSDSESSGHEDPLQVSSASPSTLRQLLAVSDQPNRSVTPAKQNQLPSRSPSPERHSQKKKKSQSKKTTS